MTPYDLITYNTIILADLLMKYTITYEINDHILNISCTDVYSF